MTRVTASVKPDRREENKGIEGYWLPLKVKKDLALGATESKPKQTRQEERPKPSSPRGWHQVRQKPPEVRRW